MLHLRLLVELLLLAYFGRISCWSVMLLRFDAERLWRELIDAYFPNPVRHKQAREYMKHVYDWRFKWWISHNVNAPTMGMLSTQRSEGWHAVVKAVISVYMPLDTFVKEVCGYVSEMDRKAEARAECRPSVSSDAFLSAFIGVQAAQYLDMSGISFRAVKLLTEEAQASFAISVQGDSDAAVMKGGELRVKTCYPDFVVLQTGVGATESDLLRHYSRSIVTLRGTSGHQHRSDVHCACSCNFPQRMSLPCRHTLACVRYLHQHVLAFRQQDSEVVNDSTLGQEIHRWIDFIDSGCNVQQVGASNSLGDTQCPQNEDSSKQCLLFSSIRGSVGSRWFHLQRHVQTSPSKTAGAPQQGQQQSHTALCTDKTLYIESRDPSRLLTEDQLQYLRDEELDSTLYHDVPRSLGGPSRRRDFPIHTNGDGCPEAYRAISGVAQNMAETFSRTQADLYAGAFFSRFLTQVLSDYSILQSHWGENSVVTCLPNLLRYAIEAAECDPENKQAPLLYETETSGTEPIWIARSMSDTSGIRGQKARNAFQRRDVAQAERARIWNGKRRFEELVTNSLERQRTAGVLAADSENARKAITANNYLTQ